MVLVTVATQPVPESACQQGRVCLAAQCPCRAAVVQLQVAMCLWRVVTAVVMTLVGRCQLSLVRAQPVAHWRCPLLRPRRILETSPLAVALLPPLRAHWPSPQAVLCIAQAPLCGSTPALPLLQGHLAQYKFRVVTTEMWLCTVAASVRFEWSVARARMPVCRLLHLTLRTALGCLCPRGMVWSRRDLSSLMLARQPACRAT